MLVLHCEIRSTEIFNMDYTEKLPIKISHGKYKEFWILPIWHLTQIEK